MSSSYDAQCHTVRHSANYWFSFLREAEESSPAARTAKFGPLVDIEIPRFHEEFTDTDFPAGFDEEALRPLRRLYLEAFRGGWVVARTQPWLKAAWLKAGEIPQSGAYFKPEDYARRYHSSAALHWLQNKVTADGGRDSKIPRFLEWKEDIAAVGYLDGSKIRANWSNYPDRKNVYNWNKTHVAVGFNDLIALLKAQFVDETGSTADNPFQVSTSSRAFRFVGVDMNPYSVAKAEVLWEMLSDKTVPVAAVVQVWYSATWTADTLTTFEDALSRVLARKGWDTKEATPENYTKSVPAAVGTTSPANGTTALAADMWVRIHGLQSEAGLKLNGREGLATEFDSTKGRWSVQLDKDLAWKQVKPENLDAAVAAAEEGGGAACNDTTGLNGGGGRGSKKLCAGRRVRVQGLQSKAGRKLNGQEGVLFEIAGGESPRWLVRLNDMASLDAKKIKEENLLPLPTRTNRGGEQVREYLQHWARACDDGDTSVKPLSVPEARKAWWAAQIQKCPEKELYFIGSLKRPKDRRAACRYACSGDVFCTGGAGKDQPPKKAKNAARDRQSGSSYHPAVGSVCMWNVPKWAPAMEAGFALGVLSVEDYLRAYLGEDDFDDPNTLPKRIQAITAESGNTSSGTTSRGPDSRESLALVVAAARCARNADLDIVQLFVWFVRRRLEVLFRDPLVTFSAEFICDKIGLDNRPLLDRIGREYQPWTMSWSNVCDYLKPSDFHKVARICSQTGDTLHFLYSMNWVLETWGANIMDFCMNASDASNAKRDDVLTRCMDRESGKARGIDVGLMTVGQVREAQIAIDTFFTTPLREDPENLASHQLAWEHYQAWVKEHFLKKGDCMKCPPADAASYLTGDNNGLSHANLALGLPNPLQRVSPAACFTITYDPAIQLNAVTSLSQLERRLAGS